MILGGSNVVFPFCLIAISTLKFHSSINRLRGYIFFPLHFVSFPPTESHALQSCQFNVLKQIKGRKNFNFESIGSPTCQNFEHFTHFFTSSLHENFSGHVFQMRRLFHLRRLQKNLYTFSSYIAS